EPGFLKRVDDVAEHLWQGLRGLVAEHGKIIRDVRGAGLMIGLDCVVENTVLRAKLHDLGLLTVAAAENVIRLLPPLIIDQSHIDQALGILSQACRELEEG
ncbi:MAG TPA: aminotransferase class III-fold pyridoxal phosphate-dependent enzyme, partial [Rhodospirillales bacterium]|nr:aminotransferase class III-fold pyridoxal phosphate-dependent enzyme [Rhodospirillales bacterium]